MKYCYYSEVNGLVRQSRTGKTETQCTATLTYKTQEEKRLKFPHKNRQYLSEYMCMYVHGDECVLVGRQVYTFAGSYLA